MKSIYLKEQKRYTYDELINLLERTEINKDEAKSAISKLKEYGVLKTVKNSKEQKDLSNLQDVDFEPCDASHGKDKLYVFTYVGVLVVGGCVLKCYPKYLCSKDGVNDKPEKEMRQVVRVLERYKNKKYQILRMLTDVSDLSEEDTNDLDLYLFFLWDYYDNGLYSNVMDTIESNGSGEIIWGKTVNEVIPIFSNKKPIYPEVYTRKRVEDEYDYFRCLHKYVLTQVSKELNDADLLDLFDLSGVDFSDEIDVNFGNDEYILYRLNNELNRQFNSRKHLVLKAMRVYFKRDIKLTNANYISSFGTTSFNLVWEKALGAVFDNKVNEKLGNLGLILHDDYIADCDRSLIELIDYPHWEMPNKDADKTLIPDIICIRDDMNQVGKKLFLILDAKYYTPVLEGKSAPSNQPGVEDITKQYLYQLAYQKFINDHNMSVKNYFLFPTEKEEIIDGKRVHLEFLSKFLSNCNLKDIDCNLKDIEVRFLPAKKVFDCYLSGSKLGVDSL